MSGELNSSNGIKIIPECVEKPIQNILEPPSKSIGESLSDVWAIVFGDRLSYFRKKADLKYAAALEKYQKELNNAASNIPPEKRIEPDFQTASQALDDSKYCIENSELRDLFVRLITATMNSDKQDTAHPAFSGIIKQMSTKDALVFKAAYITFSTKYIPMICPKILIGGTNSFFGNALPAWYSGLSVSGCNIFEISTSFVNLQRLGLIDLMYDRNISDDSVYEPLFSSSELSEILAIYQSRSPQLKLHLDSTKCSGYITEFGQTFAKCCL